MTTACCPQPIVLHRPWWLRLLDAGDIRLRPLRRRLAAWRAARAERRDIAQAEREMSRLSLRTLQDIGAPQGLIGQRRWRDEREDALWTFSLHQRS